MGRPVDGPFEDFRGDGISERIGFVFSRTMPFGIFQGCADSRGVLGIGV
jgi:hypothetical protein